MSNRAETTQVLGKAAGGDSAAVDQLFPLIYDELRRLAQRYLSSGGGDNTLQATAVVHEAYVKLIDHDRTGWQDRAHFFAVAARALRQILIDHARGKQRVKRWGGQQRVSFEDALSLGQVPDTHLFSLTDALEKLATAFPDQAEVVEMRFFAGLTQKEIAEVLGVSLRTVERRWRLGRAWMYRELSDEDEADA